MSSIEFSKVRQGSIVKHTEMPAETAAEAVEIITAAIDKYLSSENFEKAAQMIKENMDKKFGATWHVCMGEGFGFEVTHEARQLIYLQHAERLGVVVFKC